MIWVQSESVLFSHLFDLKTVQNLCHCEQFFFFNFFFSIFFFFFFFFFIVVIVIVLDLVLVIVCAITILTTTNKQIGNHSSGKSSFINYMVQEDLQLTGTAPLDDCFTVIQYGENSSEQDGPA